MDESLDYGEVLINLLASSTIAGKDWAKTEDGEEVKIRGFKDKGDIVILLGENKNEMGNSEYLKINVLAASKEVPVLDPDLEKRVQATCKKAIAEDIIKSANECTEGGLAVALAESCMINGLGARVNIDADFETDTLLFGETRSRIIISLKREQVERFSAIANENNVPTTVLGMVEEETLDILANDSIISVPVELIEKIWRRSIECAKQ